MAGEFVDLAEALEKGLGVWLAEHAAVQASFGTNSVRVMAGEDDRTVFPRIQTGEDNFFPASTQGRPARMGTSRIHIWTRESGFTLCKRIGSAVLGALTVTDADGVNNGLAIAGYRVTSGFNVLERYMRDPAENVRHGVLDFEMRFVPAA